MPLTCGHMIKVINKHSLFMVFPRYYRNINLSVGFQCLNISRKTHYLGKTHIKSHDFELRLL